MGLFSNITNTVSNVTNTVTDALGEVADTAVDAGKEVKQTLDNAGKEILNEGKDFVEDCWDAAVDEGEEFIDHLNEGAQTVSKNTEKFIDKAGEMAQTATEKGIDTISTIASSATEEFQELQQDVEDTISLLQNTTPEELADAGWDAIGFSKEERNSLKDSFHEALEATGSFVEEAIQHAVDTGTKVTTDAIEDFIDKMDLPQRMDDFGINPQSLGERFNTTLDSAADAILDTSKFISENKEIFEPLADLADGAADILENEHVQTVMGTALGLALTPAGGLMMQKSLAMNANILRAAADIPELAEDITNNPTKFKDSVNLLRPAKTVEKIKSLKPGQSFKLELGAGGSFGKEGAAKAGGEIEFKRLPNNKLSVTFKPTLDASVGLGLKDNGVEGKLQVQPQIELELSDDTAVNVIMKMLQAQVHKPGSFDLSDIDGIDDVTVKKVAYGSQLGAEVSGSVPEAISAGGKLSITSEAGIEKSKEGNDKYISYGLSGEVALSQGSSMLSVALPDGSKAPSTGVFGQVNDLLHLMPAEELEQLASTFNNNDTTWEAKASADLNIKLTQKANNTIEASLKGTVKLTAGPKTLLVESEAKIKDLGKLASALNMEALKLQEDIKQGKINISDIQAKLPQLADELIDVSYKVVGTDHDKSGISSSTEFWDVNISGTSSQETVLLDSKNPNSSKNLTDNVDKFFNSPAALTKKAATRVHDLMRASGQIMMK